MRYDVVSLWKSVGNLVAEMMFAYLLKHELLNIQFLIDSVQLYLLLTLDLGFSCQLIIGFCIYFGTSDYEVVILHLRIEGL